ncbi:MAG: PQQ-dependent sugar dehydrogenase [Verrucomicrobiales bacterium]|nr:PQQ-dependent sugar dehydrogenase [Verrucomicrobiales bacterium]
MVLVGLDAGRLLVADQVGIVHVLQADGSRRAEPFLDLRPKLCPLNQGFDERGLLGLSLHPAFQENRKLYVYYSAPLRSGLSTNWNHTAHLSEFTVNPEGSKVDLTTERVLLRVDQPYFNHNGGRTAFGPDGYLYLGLGDGGNGNDQGHDRSPVGNAQDLTTLLGKILRLDVDRPGAGLAYGIPADNPLIGRVGARPEIFAWGIRNPWGMTFDRGGAHDLLAADVGQGRYEEINLIRKGRNYGWNQREGHHAFDPNNPGKIDVEGVMQPADRSALEDPVLEYRNLNTFPKDPQALGISVTGGYVYRGKSLAHLHGKYIFADWSRQWAVPDGRLFTATRTADAPWKPEPLPVASHPDFKLGAYVIAFGEDADGEVYVLTSQRAGLTDRTGVVWKLAPAPPTGR